jgi:hypothetical protein
MTTQARVKGPTLCKETPADVVLREGVPLLLVD